MPNSIGVNGVTFATQAELVAQYQTAFQTIYGSDINLDSDTPDGQMMNIFIQSILDLQDLMQQIYNSMDPDNAIGTILDQRVSINGIQRQAGTYTVTNVTIVTNQALNLYGLDQTSNPVFTVADNAGNQFQLQTTQNISAAGSHVYAFQAVNPGAVLTVPNTITVPVTIVLGVTSINNPTSYTTLGVNEETDAALRIRRAQSVAIASQGYLSGLLSTLENVPGVTAASVYENTTGTTNGDNVPGHSIWVIVAGSAADSAIAQVIYEKRNAGCGMYGSITYTITQVDGSPFVVSWDTIVPQTLYIKFNASSIDQINPPLTSAIATGLATNYNPGVYGEVNVSQLGTLVQQIDPNTYITNAGFSTDNVTFTNIKKPSAKNQQFSISSGNISITVV